ncbi:MAG TPA: glycosyltransferase family 4 protein [Pyrinomonadaceae bacterium]|nr:glycosyltransferase family 4 protein [Pyrinomonadaceae bacterium]
MIHQAFVSPTEAGGTRHYELARHCIKAGHNFAIVASDLSYLTGQKVSSGEGFVTEQNADGVRVLRSYTYPSLHTSFVWRVISFLSFMFSSVWAGLKAGPVDVVMGTSPPIFQAFSAWLVSAIRRKPFLLEIRDLWPAFAIDMGVLKNPLLISLSRALERFLYWRADHLLVNSPAYRDYLIDRGIPDEKVSFIANGVDPNMFDPAASGGRVRKEFNLEGKFVVTYAGAIGMANDLSTILKAAQQLSSKNNVHFLLVGDGKERATMESNAREIGLANVTFTGARPKSEMQNFLAASNACVATLKDIPMFRTTYPNKVFDYMAAARPTILAIDGVIREVIEAAHGGIFVRPGSSDDIANAVRRLSENPTEAAEMGAKARDYVVQHFNRHIQAESFLQLLLQLTRSQN